jgi:Zn-dependent peptidase ImmA (M78 family)/transcriptional regulator with XRE-family HTH domain
MKGFNQGDVAERAGISRNAYRAIETGDSEPREGNLQKIATALGVTVMDLVRPVPELKTVRFRSHRSLTAQQRALRENLVTEFALWLQDFNELEELLNVEEESSLKDSNPGKPEQAARRAREALGLHENCPVIDICDVLERAGIKLYQAAARLEQYFGLSAGKDDGGPAIAVNTLRSIPVERRIFSVAHELGHLLLHRESYDGSERIEDPQEEHEANLFGGYFLMPAKAFEREWEDNRGLHFIDRVMKVKRHFQVSYKTVLMRLVQDGELDNSIWKHFPRYYEGHVRRPLQPKKEPFPLAEPDFEEDRLDHLVRNALEKNLISTDRAAEILSISVEDMRERIRSWEVVG